MGQLRLKEIIRITGYAETAGANLHSSGVKTTGGNADETRRGAEEKNPDSRVFSHRRALRVV